MKYIHRRVSCQHTKGGFHKVFCIDSKVSLSYASGMAKKRIGRPPKAVKAINPVRQVGRWPESDWLLVKHAAEKADKSVAEWAREKLLRAARRELGS
jgi:hypothetical protein